MRQHITPGVRQGQVEVETRERARRERGERHQGSGKVKLKLRIKPSQLEPVSHSAWSLPFGLKRERSTTCVSICTFVLEKQANWAHVAADAVVRDVMRQYLYFASVSALMFVFATHIYYIYTYAFVLERSVPQSSCQPHARARPSAHIYYIYTLTYVLERSVPQSSCQPHARARPSAHT